MADRIALGVTIACHGKTIARFLAGSFLPAAVEPVECRSPRAIRSLN